MNTLQIQNITLLTLNEVVLRTFFNWPI